MKVEVKEPKSWQRVLEIDATLELLNQETVQLYRRYSREVALPGFRKGKVPKKLIRAKYGQAIEREALERAIPTIYQQALKKTNQRPLTEAIVEDVKYKPEEGVSFKATFEVVPPLEVKDYKGIALERRARRVTRGRIRDELDSLRGLHRELITVARRAAEGDYLLADYICRDTGGHPVQGCSGTNYSLYLNGEGLTAGLLGAKAGEKREIRHVHPQNHPNKRLAGAEAIYEFEVRAVKETRLPRLDNDFAKDVGFKSLRELKGKLREELAARDEKTSQEELEIQLMEKLISMNAFEPPPSLVESHLASLVEDARRRLRPGEEPDDETLRRGRRPLATYRAKRGIILDSIAQQEGIESSDQELEERIREIAKSSKMDVQALRDLLDKRGELEAIKAGLRREKSVKFLLENAEIRTIRKKGE